MVADLPMFFVLFFQLFNTFFFGRAVQRAGSQLPNQLSNPWEHRVLTTGWPGMSLNIF